MSRARRRENLRRTKYEENEQPNKNSEARLLEKEKISENRRTKGKRYEECD